MFFVDVRREILDGIFSIVSILLRDFGSEHIMEFI
jgi:hypothetical protein